MTTSPGFDRYAIYDSLGVGGTAAVHLGISRVDGQVVAIKRLHQGHARDAGAVARLIDEVRVTRHVVHPNVVRVLDFVSDGEEMLSVMEYVHAEPLSRLLTDARAAGGGVPIPIAVAIVRDFLLGLHAAHEAVDTDGVPLGLVHRDVTPENVLVGADGLSRLMDFGVAKATGRLHATKDGGVRGKLQYLAPEQVGGEVTRRTDIYAAGLVLWEILRGERPFSSDNEAQLLMQALDPNIAPPGINPTIDAAVMRALAKDPEGRYPTALDFYGALEIAAPQIASVDEVAAWVHGLAGARLDERSAKIDAMLAGDKAEVTHLDNAYDVPATRRATPMVLVVLGATLAIGAYVVGVRTSRPDPAVTVAPVAATEITYFPPAPSSAPSVAPSADPTSTAPKVVTRRPFTRPAGPPVQPPPPPAPPPSKCDPPWLIDDHGVKRYNPDCYK